MNRKTLVPIFQSNFNCILSSFLSLKNTSLRSMTFNNRPKSTALFIMDDAVFISHIPRKNLNVVFRPPFSPYLDVRNLVIGFSAFGAFY